MLKIRLSRTGKKGQPSFKVIVQEHTSAVKGGKVVEELGHYLPATPSKTFTVKKDRIDYWISVGAKPSPTLASLLKKDGFSNMEKYLTAPSKKAKSTKAPVEEAPKAPVAEAPAEAPVAEAPAEAPVEA